jgi:hypothetical protein
MPEESSRQFFQFDIAGMLLRPFGKIPGFHGIPSSFSDTLASWWYVFSIISFACSAVLLFGIVYAMIRYSQLRELEQEGLREAERAWKEAHASSGENNRWRQVEARVSSDDPNDWRLAIIEADIMLEELLDALGYQGDSIGDRLKTAHPESFRSIEDAWEAHKVRNAIAHQGSDFVLTKRAAQDAIARYKHVFEEFKAI